MSLLSPPVSSGTRSATERTDSIPVRVLSTVACGPPLAGYAAAVAVLAVLVGVAPGGDLTMAGTARAAGAAWLAAHHVDLVINGAPFGVLPLLPTLLLALLVARTAARTAAGAGLEQLQDARRLIGAAAVGHAVCGVVVAVLVSSAGASAFTTSPLSAALSCGLLAAVSATCGVARQCGLLPAVLARAPGWAPHALVAGGLGLGVLLAAGLGAMLLGLLTSASQVSDLFEKWGPGVGSALGLLVLCIAYLPNAAIGAASWLAGPGVAIGAVSVTPLEVTAGALPAVPLLAGVPEDRVGAWWLAALGVVVLAGVQVGRRAGRAGPEPADRLRAATAGIGLLALGCLVTATLAGGRLGVFDPVDVPAGRFALAAIGWTLVPALVAAWWAEPGGRESTEAATLEDAGEQVEAEADEGESPVVHGRGDAP